jgi:hypothetical protein
LSSKRPCDLFREGPLEIQQFLNNYFSQDKTEYIAVLMTKYFGEESLQNRFYLAYVTEENGSEFVLSVNTDMHQRLTRQSPKGLSSPGNLLKDCTDKQTKAIDLDKMKTVVENC